MDMTVPPQVQRDMDIAQTMQTDLYTPKADTPVDAPLDVLNAAPTEPVAPVVAPTPVSDDFQQKYRILQGKYDAEVPRLYAQLKERDTLLQQMGDRLTALETPKAPEHKSDPLLTDKDNEDFGADLVDMARRASREEIKSEMKVLMKAIDERFASLNAHLGQVQEKVVMSESDKFWGRVRSLVPDWMAVDQDPAWVEFLDTRIPGTRKTRRQEAADAISVGDAEPIKELVDLWRGGQPDTKQDAKAAAEAAAAAKAGKKQELQSQVAPSTAKSSAQPTGKKVWLAAEYEYVFSQKAMQSMPEAELTAQQAEATLALQEGRVRW